MNMYKLLAAASAVFFIASTALAQNAGTVTNHAFALGKGPGTTGYTSLLCGSAQLAVGQAAADPICRTITGDVTIDAAGVTAIGATKVLNSMLAAMAANTTKCNATAGSASPTDCTAATMRTNIGVVIGTNVQAWDTDLDCLAAISTNGIVARTGAGTCAVRTVTAPAAGITITNGDGVAGNPTLVLANDLGALEGLSGTGIARRTGTDTWSVGTLVTNAERAQMAAYTLKGNATGATANEADIDVTALTAKAAPVSADIVLIQDSAAANAFKKTTVGALASAGSVASYNGRTGAVTATGTDVPLRGYLSGLTLSTAGTSATFGIAVGVATDSTNVSMMALASAYTKTTSAWALGTAAGSLDTGAIANSTWYHVYLIQRPDTGVVDILISLSATAPTLPTNYTLFRRIGSMKTNGSAQWIKFIQDGDLFTWDVPVADVNVVNPGTAAVTRTLTAPLGVRVQALTNITIQSSTAGFPGALLASDLSVTDTAPSVSAVSVYLYNNAAAISLIGSMVQTMTNTSSQIRTRFQSSDATTQLYVNTIGWVDRRGRDS